MCTATGFGGIFKKMMQANPSIKLREQISANDPASKALGYEGLADPLGDLQHSLAGTDSKLDRKIKRNQAARTQAAVDAERPGTAGHTLSIAAMKARRGGV